MAAAGAVEPAAPVDAARPAATAAPTPWIGSPGWDLFWMFSALWGAALLLAGATVLEVTAVAGALFVINRFVSITHSWSTTYMVLFSPLLAEERRARRIKFQVVPLAIAVLAFALGYGVAGWQRFPASGRFDAGLWIFALYIGLFWVGHFWHFGNQDFGVLTIYRARAGQDRLLDRRVDKLYTVLMMFVIQPIVYLSIVRTTAFAEMAYTWLPITRAGVETAAQWAMGAAVVLSLGAIGFELSKATRSLPRLLYLLVIFAHPALLFAVGWTREPTYAFLYVIAYMWSHWFIATGLVARIHTGYQRSRGASPAGARLRHVAVLGGIALAVWLFTWPFQTYGLFNTDGYAYKQVLADLGAAQVPLIGFVLGFFLAEQLLHYYCDRCLFRFRDAGVRAKVAPHLL